ncbi:hypothetical protein FF38_05107 [Lucilia cuprina]|uniref:Uncharacterized protein n=1 Tax=Lucilia cuprina TaxID=7375 RepID=A0A0L0C5Q8_LUCCU|nr:hypothetical protein FF38_05107 [Lucilia cuprina]
MFNEMGSQFKHGVCRQRDGQSCICNLDQLEVESKSNHRHELEQGQKQRVDGKRELEQKRRDERELGQEHGVGLEQGQGGGNREFEQERRDGRELEQGRGDDKRELGQRGEREQGRGDGEQEQGQGLGDDEREQGQKQQEECNFVQEREQSFVLELLEQVVDNRNLIRKHQRKRRPPKQEQQ